MMRKIKWKKMILSEEFISESCCFYKITNECISVIAGEYIWFITDKLEKKKIREIEDAWLPDWPYKDKVDKHAELRKDGGNPQYKADTYDFIIDIHEKPILITVGMHKDPIHWYVEKKGMWEKKLLTEGGIYESVICTDLFDSNKNVLVTIPQKPYVAWYAPDNDTDENWIHHVIGNIGGDWHGLGVGDINGDGKKEVITSNGFYSYDNQKWNWVPIYVYDENGVLHEGMGDVFKIIVEKDVLGEPIIFSSSPHGFGFWYWKIVKCEKDGIVLRRKTICDNVSQLHNIMSITEEGNIFVCTGKRKYAHGRNGDIDSNGESKLLLFQIDDSGNEKLEVIDNNSGAGIHFDFQYQNNAFYIVTSNKNGVFLFVGEKIC